MSNLHEVKPRVTKITLNDGVERELKFTLNAMAELEDRYGEVQKAFDALNAGSFKTIRFMLWAGLVHADENLTEKQVGNLIDMSTLQEIIDSMTDAISESLPEEKDTVAGIPNA